MKKLMVIMLVVVFIALPCISFAEEGIEAKEGKHHMYKKMEKGGMKGMGMHSMMMKKMMMSKEIVATQDGGVIVLTGNKLMKFDKDLNLIKEVEIKMDMEGMMKKMKECREMMKKHGIEEGSE